MRRRGERTREEAVGAELRRLHVPDEDEFLDRALALAAREGRRRATPGRASRRRIAAALTAAGAALAVAFTLTPAGAAMRDWIGNAVDGAPSPTRTTIGRIPSGGSLLVQSDAGPWVVRDDGSRRLLGDYDSATWSPRGLFVAVSSRRTLSAIEPDGASRWSIDAPAPVRDARWSTSGQRVAYRSGAGLRIVAGDGTGDRELADRVTPLAPSWMPASEDALSPNVLAYVDAAGRLVTTDVDGDRRLLRIALPPDTISVNWFARGRLLVVARRSLIVVDTSSGKLRRVPVASGGAITAADVSPDGRRVAVLRRAGGASEASRARSVLREVALAGRGRGSGGSRTLFSGLGRFDGPLFSPDGSRLLLGWRQADQWLFIAAKGSAAGASLDSSGRGGSGAPARPDRVSVGDVARQFAPGSAPGDATFPVLDGWCCR